MALSPDEQAAADRAASDAYGRGAAMPKYTGNFVGDPANVIDAIQAMRNPQERANALVAFNEQAQRTPGFANGAGFTMAPQAAPVKAAPAAARALTPEEQQAQSDRAAIDAFARSVMGVGDKVGAAYKDIITLPTRAGAGILNTALRLPNAFGAGIPYIPDNGFITNMMPFSNALNAAAPGAGAGRGMVNPPGVDPNASMPALPTAAKPAAAPADTGPAAPPPRAAATAAAPQEPPHNPRVTGDNNNSNTLVPYGFDPAPAGGGAPAGSAAAMPGNYGVNNQDALIDPRSYFDTMVAAQMRYANSAAQNILDQAGNGSQLGYSARLRALASVYLNGLAGVGQGGANTFNSATASLSNAQTESEARRYTSNNALTGDLARAGATVRAAEIGAVPHVMEAENRSRALDTDSVPTGTTLGSDPITHLAVPLTTYGQRPPRAGAMPMPYDTTPTSSKPKEGATVTVGGKTYVRANGQWMEQR